MKKILTILFILIMSFSFLACAESFSLSETTAIYYQPASKIVFGKLESGYTVTEKMILNVEEIDNVKWYKIKLEQSKVYIEGWIRGNMLNEVSTNGFIFKNVKFRPELGIMKLVGKITNSNNKDYIVANFRIIFYDENNKQIYSQDINLFNIKADETQSLEGLTYIKHDLSNMKRFKIEFKGGF